MIYSKDTLLKAIEHFHPQRASQLKQGGQWEDGNHNHLLKDIVVDYLIGTFLNTKQTHFHITVIRKAIKDLSKHQVIYYGKV